MLGKIQETRIWEATLIFDVVDGFARTWGLDDPRIPAEDDLNPPKSLAGLKPRPLGDVTFDAVAKWINGQRIDFAQPVRLTVRRNPSGYFLFYGKVKREKGVVLRDVLTPGTYAIQVNSPYYLTIELPEVFVPMPDPNKPLRIELDPSSAYPFPAYVKLLRGTMRQIDGAGMAGVKISTDKGNARYITAENGDWVVPLPMPPKNVPPPPPAPDADPSLSTIKVTFVMPDGTQQIEPVTYDYKKSERVTTVAVQGALTGQIVDARGYGLAGVFVELPDQAGSVMTAAQGKWTYVFQRVAADTAVDAIIVNGQRQELTSSIAIRAGKTAYAPVLRLT